MLAKCILANPPRGGRCHWRHIQNQILSRISKWKAGEFTNLWEGAIQANKQQERRFQKRAANSNQSDDFLRSANARRARRAVENGQYTKAIQSLSSAGLAKPSEALEEMLLKHPQCEFSLPSFDAIPPPLHVTSEDVLRALRSFHLVLPLALQV